MNDTYIMGAEARSIERQNADNHRRWMEEEKEQEQRMAKARLEWEATPDSERLCIQCGLKLSHADIGRITEKPTLPRHHDFCNPFKIGTGVVRGLVNLLREAYGDDPIPLESLRRLVETWLSQGGQCYISKIAMSFPVEDKPPTPQKRPSLVDPFQFAAMERARQKEWAERKRAGELHSPVIWFDEGNNLRLLSKTIAGWKGDLSDQEFADLVFTLHEQLPSLQKKQVLDFRSVARSAMHRGRF